MNRFDHHRPLSVIVTHIQTHSRLHRACSCKSFLSCVLTLSFHCCWTVSKLHILLFYSHIVLLSRCQSQQANLPRAQSSWNSLENTGQIFGGGTAHIHPGNPMCDIPWGRDGLISRAKTMSSGLAGKEGGGGGEGRRRGGVRRKAKDGEAGRL